MKIREVTMFKGAIYESRLVNKALAVKRIAAYQRSDAYVVKTFADRVECHMPGVADLTYIYYGTGLS